MALARAEEEDLSTDPMMLYQRGLAQSHRGQLLSLQTLAAARDGLREKQDARGVALAAAALLIAGQCMTNYRGFREHAASLAGLRDGSLQFFDRTDDLLTQAGLLCALLFLNPSDDAIDGCVARIMALLELDIDVNVRYAAGRLVIYYTEPREMRELGQRVYGLLQPLAEHPDLTPHRLGRWLILWIRVTANAKDPTQHRRACAQARELAERHGEPEVAAWMLAAEIDQALRVRDYPSIERALASIEALSDPANLSDMTRLSWLKGRFTLAKGEKDPALFHAGQSRRYAEELELPPPMLGVRLALEAQAKVLIGDYAGAREQFKRTSEIVAVLHAEEMRDMIRMVDAYEACDLHRSDARALLVTAFAAPRARQFYDVFDTNPPFGATMCALALEHDVEVEFARRIIELHGMAAPANAGESWPWPVRVHTLGAFELSHASGTVAVHAKMQKKPLELLKALVALGGHRVDKSRLANLLWPEVEPATAAAALDRDVEALQTALRSASAGDDEEVTTLARRVLTGYRGAFLENEEPQRWMLAARDRWRSRYLRSLTDVGRYWERHERWPQASEIYERGIEVEPLAEELYRLLMHCHLAQGQTAQAARVYRQCRETLSVQLGLGPSADTEALFKSIYKHQ